MKKILFLSMAIFLFVGIFAQSVDKRNPDTGETKPVSTTMSRADDVILRGATSPLIYATEGPLGIYKTTLGAYNQPGTQLSTPPVHYQAMEMVNEIIYVVTFDGANGDNTFGTFQPESGIFNLINSAANVPDAISMAWNPVNNEVYCTQWGDATVNPFGKIDLTTGVFTSLGSTSFKMYITIDNEGVCYGLDMSNNRFGTVNLSNGTFSSIRTYTDNFNFIQDLFYDRELNELYHACRLDNNDVTQLRKINKANGTATTLGGMQGRKVESVALFSYNVSQSAPAEVTNLAVTPGAAGALTAAITWTNPTLTVNGGTLSSITSVNIYENNGATPIHTISNPAPGSPGSYTATVSAPGYYIYKVVAVNAAGDGLPASASAWIGHDVPAAPQNVTLVENNFEATVSWTAPSTGSHGGYFTPAGLVYDVYRYPENIKVSSDQSATTFIETPSSGYIYYKIVAKNPSGEGDWAISNTETFCQATAFPYFEGFENNGTELPVCWWHEEFEWSTSYWQVVPGTAGNPASAHGGSYIARFTDGYATDARMSTPSLNISNLLLPTLKFWHTQLPGMMGNDQLSVYYKTSSSADWILLQTYTPIISNWTEETIILPNKSTDYYIGFYGQTAMFSGGGMQLDDVTIYDAAAFVDLELAQIVTPAAGIHPNLTANEPVTVVIKNNSLSAVSNFSITLDCNGTTYTETYAASLNGATQTNYTFNQLLDLSAVGEYIITVTVTIAGDQIPENDSKTITVTKIDCSTPVFYISEGFEGVDFPPSCWTAIDIDGGGTQWERNTSSFYLHSGIASAAHMYAAGMQEGWLITPQIDISSANYLFEFWSYNRYPTDNFCNEIWVSTAENPELSTFTRVKKLAGAEISAAWKKITIPLSGYAGEKIYIAFKYMGNDADGWCIDDVELYDTSVKYTITLSANNPDWGTVTGAGLFAEGSTITVEAIENTGYLFVNWTEGGVEVSTDAAYTFDVTTDRNLVANFIMDGCSTPVSYISEGFEGVDFPPACWRSIDVDGGGTQWERYVAGQTQYIHSGIACAAHMFAAGMQEGWLITPKINISTSNYLFEFWSYHRYPADNYCSEIWISTAANPELSTFTMVKKLTGTEVSGTYKKITIPLNGYAGEKIYIAFKYMGNDADGWCVDDVEVYNNSVEYTVTLSANNSDWGAVSGAGTFEGGETVTVNATANGGYIFVNWTENGDEVSTLAEYSFTIVGNRNLVAHFAVDVCSEPVSYISEGFEGVDFPPACWRSIDIDGGGTQWERYVAGQTQYIHSGIACAAHMYAAGMQEGWLITPKINISSDSYLFEFWSYHRYPADNYCSEIWISTAANPELSTFTMVKKLTGTEVSSTYKKITIPLSSYAGEKIYIAFKYMGNDADGWCVDDVEVYNNSVEYTVTLSANNSDWGTVTGAGTFEEGETVTVNATANGGYIFVNWTENGDEVSTVAEYSFTITDNRDLVANFVAFSPVTFTITAIADPNGIITPSGAVQVASGANQTFEAAPISGYNLSAIYVDGVFDANASATGIYTFENVTANHIITAFFAKKTYQITTIAGAGGYITPENPIVEHGGSVTLNFVPQTGYKINTVLIDGVANPAAVLSGFYTFTNVIQAHTVEVTFTKIVFTITATHNTGGSITPSGVATVEYGEDSEIYVFNPNTGYLLQSVVIDGTNNPQAVFEGEYHFTNVTANHSIYAIFAPVSFTITATADQNGTITPNGAVSVVYGAMQSFNTTPNNGYDLNAIYVDGILDVNASSTGTYTFENVTANHTISASFVKKTYQITTIAGAGGYIMPENPIVEHGGSVTLNFVPQTGYKVNTVLIDGVANPAAVLAGFYTFTNVTQAHTVEVTFVDNSTLTYNVYLPTVEGATIAPVGGSTSPVEDGGTYMFTVILEEGYTQSNIIVRTNDTDIYPLLGIYIIKNISEDQYITVEGVAINQYQIVAKAHAGGTILPEGTVTVTHGEDKTYEIIPNENYVIDRVEVNGISEGEAGSYTFYNVKADATIHAYFKLNVGISEKEEAIISVFSHQNVVTIVNEHLVPVQQVEIMDMYGRIVWSGQAPHAKTEITLNVATGIYAVRINTNDNRNLTTKVIIQ